MTRPSAVVVVASSSGGLDPLRKIAASLPPDFPAAVVVASHTVRTRTSLLPVILSTDGQLPAMVAHDRQALEQGKIFVAPANRHLRVERGGTLRVSEQPKDSFVRPSADVLFQSAARAYGARAVGIVLSGRGDDGAQGLAAIRAAGGIAVIQSPIDAEAPSMPRTALAVVTPDACVPAAEIATVVGRLLRARLASARSARPARPRRKPRGPSLKGLRVLVAEDRYLLGSEIVGMLHKLGCTAAGPVADVDSGLRLLESDAGGVDCALLDVDLRGTPVYPLALALRDRGVPVVFATGHVGTLSQEWRSTASIEKPFDTKGLGAALRWARDRPHVAALPARAVTAPHRAVERLKELRNLLMVSRAWLRNHASRLDQRAADDIDATARSVRSSHKAVEQSRARMDETHAAVKTSRSRQMTTKRAIRSWPRGEDD